MQLVQCHKLNEGLLAPLGTDRSFTGCEIESVNLLLKQSLYLEKCKGRVMSQCGARSLPERLLVNSLEKRSANLNF